MHRPNIILLDDPYTTLRRVATMARAIRTTITVPASLRAKMDAIGEPVNWSAVACQAFEAKVAEIISKRKVENVDDAVIRLRASKRVALSRDHKHGRELGHYWALNKATFDELRCLDSVRQQWPQEWDSGSLFLAGPHQTYNPGQQLHRCLQVDQEEWDWRDAAPFWERVAGDGYERAMHSADFVRGFADAALEFWGEVKDRV